VKNVNIIAKKTVQLKSISASTGFAVVERGDGMSIIFGLIVGFTASRLWRYEDYLGVALMLVLEAIYVFKTWR
jgi:hypothetical protein